MSDRTLVLLRKERMDVTLPILIEYYATSKQVNGCSKKTLIGCRTNLGKFLRFLEKRGHSLKLRDLTIHDARAYIASLQGKVTKFENHPLTLPIPNYTLSPETIHKHVTTLRAFSNWLKQEGYTKQSVFELLELPKLPKKQIPVLSPEEIQQVLNSINAKTFMGARLYAMVVLMIDTGVRAGEVANS